jgi:uncharacterized protein YkwD
MKKMFVLLSFIIGFSFLNTKEISSEELVSMQEKLVLLDSINKYRNELGLKNLQYSVEVEKLAKIRTKTISNHLKSIDQSEYVKNYIPHLHYGFFEDCLDFKTRLDLYNNKFTITRPMENVCHLTTKSNNLINISFKGWKNSPSHWEGMMSEGIDHISVHYEESDIGIVANMILFKRFPKTKK